MLTEMHSGCLIDPFNLKPDDIDLNDIAYHLAGIYRYNGATRLTVAQHCVLGAQKILEDTGNLRAALGFLLHDAPEAYLLDMTNPIKCGIRNQFTGFMAWFDELHDQCFKMMLKKFGVVLSISDMDLIEAYDRRILCDEANALFGHELVRVEPLGIEIKLWGTVWAEHEYRVMAKKLFIEI
jgi:hypothetical protein